MNMEPAQLVSAVGPQPLKYRTQRHRKGQLLPLHEPNSNPTGFLVFFRNDMSKTFRHFLLFSGLMHCAVLVAGPYFVIYLLQDLHLAHWQYGIWWAAGIIGQFMTLPAWGRFSDRFANKALLSFTGLLVAFLPMLYLCGTTWPFLVIVNFFGGVVWAGLGLGLNNYVSLLHSRRIAQRQLSFQVLSTPSDGPLERSLEAA